METLWFCLLWWMLATYVVLDGMDLGVGMLHLFVARTPDQRKQVIASVGPVWDGHEVWLVAAGGTLFFAFPKLYAVSLSGFYLPLMMVMWLLVFRALGIELRHQLEDRLWTEFWDAAFAIASLLLALFLGIALGNVVRGVPLNVDGVFFEPLWTDFRVSLQTGVLDWYTVVVGCTAVSALAHHGALWLSARTDGHVQRRSGRLARGLWPLVMGASVAVSCVSFWVHPNPLLSLADRPWGVLFPTVAMVGLVGSGVFHHRGRGHWAYLASAIYLYGMVASAAIGIYPYALPGRHPAHGLTVQAAATTESSLAIALCWWIPGMLLAAGYFTFMYRKLPTTFSQQDAPGH